MSEVIKNKNFWENLDTFIKESEIIIDRPKGSHHPKYSNLIYPLNYGYIKNTKSVDKAEIDIWIGENNSNRVDAIMCIVDMTKRDSEIKILFCCNEQDINSIYKFHNGKGMSGIIFKR